MLCDELRIENACVYGPDAKVYRAEQVDAAIEELKDAQRWRKFSDEKPEHEGDYLVMARYPDDDEPHIEICFYDRDGEDFGHYESRYAGSGDSFGGYDGEEWITHNVTYWMPLPKAPEEATDEV